MIFIDKEKVTEIHCKTPLPSGVKNEIIPLGKLVSITSIEGRHSDIITSLKIKLSNGKTYKFGKTYIGDSADKSFILVVPSTQNSLAITGGYNSYLHYIGIYYA